MDKAEEEKLPATIQLSIRHMRRNATGFWALVDDMHNHRDDRTWDRVMSWRSQWHSFVGAQAVYLRRLIDDMADHRVEKAPGDCFVDPEFVGYVACLLWPKADK